MKIYSWLHGRFTVAYLALNGEKKMHRTVYCVFSLWNVIFWPCSLIVLRGFRGVQGSPQDGPDNAAAELGSLSWVTPSVRLGGSLFQFRQELGNMRINLSSYVHVITEWLFSLPGHCSVSSGEPYQHVERLRMLLEICRELPPLPWPSRSRTSSRTCLQPIAGCAPLRHIGAG